MHKIGYDSALKREKIPAHAAARTNPEDMVLREMQPDTKTPDTAIPLL